MPRRKSKKPFREVRPKGKCPFCLGKTDPSYKDYEKLGAFLTDRAKIISGIRTGVCSKHQRGLAREIKRARSLALLPFVARS